VRPCTVRRASARRIARSLTSQGSAAERRNAVEDGLRAIAGAGAIGGGQAARATRATGLADDFLRNSIGGWGSQAWNAIRSGGSQLDGQALSMSERIFSAWPTSGAPRIAALNWVTDVASPGNVIQGFDVFNLGYGSEQSASVGVGWAGGELPTLSDLPFLDFNPLAR
jgi:hypothetical protein